MSIWNYLILNIIGEVQNIFENDTESKHDNVGKFWRRNNTWIMQEKSMSISKGYSGDIFTLLDFYIMTRTRFQPILQNLHFSNNNNDDKTDKSYKIHPVIEHLNKVFTERLSNSPFQSVDEHMCKFKGRLSMKQYIKNKPIKWGFKHWYRCDSETDDVYQLELYQGWKERRKLNLGSSVVLDLCQVLKGTYCHACL